MFRDIELTPEEEEKMIEKVGRWIPYKKKFLLWTVNSGDGFWTFKGEEIDDQKTAV